MNGIAEVAVTQDERTMGTLAHVLQIVGAWIAPLIIFLIKRDSKFVSFHALQALFLQIIYMVVWMMLMVVFFVAMFSTIAVHGVSHSSEPPVAIFVLMPLFWLFAMGGWVTLLVIAIIYGIKAGRGEWAKYPLIGNWVARILKIDLNPVPQTGS
jgi:uncharacterized Tic20 family protein